MNTDDDMTIGQKAIAIGFLFLMWLCAGVFVGAGLSVTGQIPDRDHITGAETLSVMLFWPLFLIKALAIGGWAVLESGYHLLIGA